MVRDGVVEIKFIPSDEMIADVFTKALPKSSFLKQSMSMGMIGIGSGLEEV
jgi:DNA topoisomerase VI subunit B